MEELLKLKEINRLKSVYRANAVPGRKESSAEHTWSCLILADYFLNKFSYKLDRIKIYELIMYHDLVEIETGDDPNYNAPGKAEKERVAAEKIRNELPGEISEKFWDLFLEFEEQKTKEAKFAKAIDVIDPIFQQISCKVEWKPWTLFGRKFVIERKEKYFNNFPEIKNVFYKLLDYLEKNGFLKK